MQAVRRVQNFQRLQKHGKTVGDLQRSEGRFSYSEEEIKRIISRAIGERGVSFTVFRNIQGASVKTAHDLHGLLSDVTAFAADLAQARQPLPVIVSIAWFSQNASAMEKKLAVSFHSGSLDPSCLPAWGKLEQKAAGIGGQLFWLGPGGSQILLLVPLAQD